ncbi:DUF58 domain-containing protein [Paenibacillus sp. F411]|uniref:DUF58 domain-containing protein n=1 Tax=Paenibacillus sp. F411 TaxID=2820239 RepID=UPI001AAE89ED|nr:DUF58 domain-containing protein [Paenibacillus sp. F411]MBO2945273.1 DUF58 domain-containing protein [Paenibacillus sp. F411]
MKRTHPPASRPATEDKASLATGSSVAWAWLRAICLWGIAGVLYTWLGGASLRFLWLLCTAILLSGALLGLTGPRAIKIDRRLSPVFIYAGEETELTVSLKFATLMPVPWMMLQVQIGGAVVRKLWFPGFRRSAEFSCRIPLKERGSWEGGTCTVKWGDMFGWFRYHREVKGMREIQVIVLPKPMNLKGYDERILAMDQQDVPSPFHSQGWPGLDLREYVPGDPLKWVHWKNSARAGRLHSRVPEQGPLTERLILLDTEASGYPISGSCPGDELFELAVSAAAGLLYRAALTQGEAYLQLPGHTASIVHLRREEQGGEGGWLLPLANVQLQASPAEADLQLDEFSASRSLDVHVVTGVLHPGLAEAIFRLRRAGKQVTVHLILAKQQTGGRELTGLERQWMESGGRLFDLRDGFFYPAGLTDSLPDQEEYHEPNIRSDAEA